ncbi:hypothetical protein DL93DRAFT_2101092 [Clavulina sp. PMI_390]|nr:hypothetical protein DL93DRAFT_2101092 [Clavulina sp. PMI_390]
MPYVDLRHSEVQLYWTSNIPGDDLNCLHTHPKPLIILLHPVLLSSEWRKHQLEDPNLNRAFYMIAIDGPTSGRSKCKNYLAHEHALKHDTWAEAAMLALFSQSLSLPPFHILAEQVVACDVANKFAILFPQQCLSLTLLAVFPPVDDPGFHQSYQEASLTWAGAQDLETLEEAQSGFAWLYFFTDREYNSLDEDEMDRFMEYFRTRHGPGDPSNGLLSAGITAGCRQPPSPEQLALIRQPILLMQGANSLISMMSAAEEQAALYASAKVQLEPIPGAPLIFGVTKRWAPTVNQNIASFITSQVFDPANFCSIDEAALRNALKQIAESEYQPSIAKRDPMSMWNYSRVAAGTAEHIRARLIPALTLEGKPPMIPPGHCIRKYSERHDEKWSTPHILGPCPLYSTVSMTTSHA